MLNRPAAAPKDKRHKCGNCHREERTIIQNTSEKGNESQEVENL